MTAGRARVPHPHRRRPAGGGGHRYRLYRRGDPVGAAWMRSGDDRIQPRCTYAADRAVSVLSQTAYFSQNRTLVQRGLRPGASLLWRSAEPPGFWDISAGRTTFPQLKPPVGDGGGGPAGRGGLRPAGGPSRRYRYGDDILRGGGRAAPGCGLCGNPQESYLREACAEYEKRLGGLPSDRDGGGEERLPDKPSEAAVSASSRRRDAVCWKRSPDNAVLVALCIEGKELSSVQLTEQIGKWTVAGNSRLAFVIGGSWGLSVPPAPKFSVTVFVFQLAELFIQHCAALPLQIPHVKLDTDSFGGISTSIWYLQFHFVCDRLFISFRLILNVLPLLSNAVARPHRILL